MSNYSIDYKELIKQAEDGLLVFKHYFPNQDITSPRKKFKIRSQEKTASASLKYLGGQWRITDFGNQSEISGMNCISWVMREENLEYIHALEFIHCQILKKDIKWQKPKYGAEYSYRELTPSDVKGEYKFTYKEEPSESDLQSIGRYVTSDLLQTFSCRAVEQYEFVGKSKKLNKDVVHIFKATDDFPIFVFDYNKFKKIYKPYERKKQYRFSYVGEKPLDYIFGLDRIKDTPNEFEIVDEEGNIVNTYSEENNEKGKTPIVKDLIRCSGETDAINLASIGAHVYWLNSESADFSPGQFSLLDDLCEKHYQLMDLDPTGKREAAKLAHKYIKLRTIQLPDYLAKRKDRRGNPCKDAKDFVSYIGNDQDQTAYRLGVLKRKAFPMQFWAKTIETSNGKKKVNYQINLENYYYFLSMNGFFSADSAYHKKAGYCYAKVEGKVVTLISPDDIKKIAKRFTKDWIRSKNLLEEVEILNKINSSNQISESNLQELPEIELDFVNCKAESEWLHFENGSLHITPTEISLAKHDDVPNYILGSLDFNGVTLSHLLPCKIQADKEPAIEVNATPEYQKLLDRYNNSSSPEEREVINVDMNKFPELDRYEVKINDDSFFWVSFLRDLSHLHWRQEIEDKKPLNEQQKKEQDLLLINLMFTLGYMCADFKHRAKPWLVFLQDMKISAIGQSSGRSGKSLLTTAMSHTRQSFYIGGRNKQLTEKTEFIYDGFTKMHSFIEIDDMHEFADFNFFYTQVTGKREVNSKHISKQILEYSNSGKMIISSNFELANTDNSTIARLLNSGVSDYFHESTKHNDYKETRTPQTKYKRMLFDDFTPTEWSKFYNFMAYCIQLQMRFYKIQPPMEMIEKRNLRRLMIRGVGKDEEFFGWANITFENKAKELEGNYSPEGKFYFNSYFERSAAFEAFKSTLTDDQARKFKAPTFKKSLKAWCEYYGYELNPISECTGVNPEQTRSIKRTRNGKTTEYFYICTNPEEFNNRKLSEEEIQNLGL